MRRILYKKMTSLLNRSKAVSVSETSEDKECKTYVRKNFVYIVTPDVEPQGEEISPPDIYIKKSFDSKTKEERFSFRVKGSFFITRERAIYKVSFCHSLSINISWKLKVFSPKSVTLT